MKRFLKPGILPWFTLGCGGLGLVLRIWLYSGVDHKGLLPVGHLGSALAYILTALVFGVLFLCVRQLNPEGEYTRLFPAGFMGAMGCVAGASGILAAAVCQYVSGDVLSLLSVILGFAAFGCLGKIGLHRLQGSRPSVYAHMLVTVFLLFYTVGRCRGWGSEPQVQIYIFPLLACIFLMLTGYYQSALGACKNCIRQLVFCSQAAVFCCCLSLNGEHPLFYMGMILYLTLDLCGAQKEQTPETPAAEEE